VPALPTLLPVVDQLPVFEAAVEPAVVPGGHGMAEPVVPGVVPVVCATAEAATSASAAAAIRRFGRCGVAFT
jgi:hypothetical protein